MTAICQVKTFLTLQTNRKQPYPFEFLNFWLGYPVQQQAHRRLDFFKYYCIEPYIGPRHHMAVSLGNICILQQFSAPSRGGLGKLAG